MINDKTDHQCERQIAAKS